MCDLWMIIDEQDAVLCDGLTLERAEDLLTKWSDDAECWMVRHRDHAPKSEHYIPNEEV